jgi:hypothetical protein
MLENLSGEKRTDRLDVPKQLRVGEMLGKLVRKLAARNQRTIQEQLVVLVTKGIEAYCRETGNSLTDLLHETASDFVRPGLIRADGVRRNSKEDAA